MRITTAPARDRVNLAEVDLFGPDLYADGDPHSVWAAMRAEAPLHRQTLPDGRSFLSVTRFRDACRVLGDSAAFTSERGSLLEQLGHGDAAAGKMLVSTDPPRHTALRIPQPNCTSADGPTISTGCSPSTRSRIRPIAPCTGEPSTWLIRMRPEGAACSIARIAPFGSIDTERPAALPIVRRPRSASRGVEKRRGVTGMAFFSRRTGEG